MSEQHKEYIGDGVYASFDGYQIWLRTQEGSAIALDGETFSALLRYKDRLIETIRQRRAALEAEKERKT